MENWKKIEPDVWKPEKEGDEIVGVLISREKSGQFDNWVYHFEITKDKKLEQVVVFGTTVLNDRLSYVKPGQRVKITYKGTQKNKRGQDTKIFDVYTSEDYIHDHPEESDNPEVIKV